MSANLYKEQPTQTTDYSNEQASQPAEYSYGQPGYSYEQTVQPVTEENKGFSITSMVLGIVGFLAWCLPLFGYPVTIAGIVFGILGMKKGGKGMAIAGIAMSIITLIFTLINSILGAILNVAYQLQ